jgi:hypothetical protein
MMLSGGLQSWQKFGDARRTKLWNALLTVVALILLAPGCDKRDLRGAEKPSADGQTYLVLDDDKNGTCPLQLDGHPWTAKAGTAVPVTPGDHEIECKGIKPGASFNVRAGTTFHFDYWGP